MKYAHALVLFTIAIILFSCDTTNNKNIATLANGYIEIDSIATMGKDFHFGFEIDESKDSSYFQRGVYAKFYPTLSNSDNIPSPCPLIKLEYDNAGFYRGNVHIQDGVAGFRIWLIDGSSEKSRYVSPIYRVFDSSRTPVQNSMAVYMQYFTNDDYLHFFFQERSLYPENIGIFAERWYYEGLRNLMIKDTIEQQVDYLRKNHSSHPFYPYVMLLGEYLLHNTVNTEHLANIRKDVNAIPLHSVVISMALADILSDNINALQDIVHNNPYSELSEIIIRRRRYFKYDPSITLNLLRKRRAYFNDAYLDYHTALILYKKFPDSLITAQALIDTLCAKIDRDYSFRACNEYPNSMIDCQTNLIYCLASDISRALGQTEKARRYLVTTENRHIHEQDGATLGYIYYKHGALSAAINNYTEALQYYLRAYYYMPSIPPLNDSLHLIHSRDIANVSGKHTYSQWLDSLQATLDLEKVALPHNLPQLEWDSAPIYLHELGYPALAVFWSESCHFCDEEMHDILTYFKRHPQSKAKVLVFATAPGSFLEHYNETSLPNNMSVIANASEFVKPFKIKGYPVSIMLSSNGMIQRKIAGYSSSETVYQMLSTLDKDS